MSQAPVKLFISYAKEDEAYKQDLVNRLKPFKRNGDIEDPDDQEILTGEVWEEKEKEAIEAAHIIIFLISPDFIHSDYLNDVHLAQALEHYRQGAVVIVPIIIRPVDLSMLPISKFQALPKNAKPISTWGIRDKAWLEVQRELGKVIEKLRAGKLKLNQSQPEAEKNVDKSKGTPKTAKKDTISKAREMIMDGELKKAIKLLMENTTGDSSTYNQLILQSARISSLDKNRNMGFVSGGEYKRSNSQITHALLQMITDME